jgi:polysaccharide biosynthesis/export protein
MKHIIPVSITVLVLSFACVSQKKLAYLGNLPKTDTKEVYPMDIPDYRIQPRDVLYITVKAMAPDGTIRDFFSSGGQGMIGAGMSDAGGLYGYDVNSEGNIILPAIGTIKVSGLTLEETRKLLQESAEKVFRNSTVECKLLSFKYTVIGEVRGPGTYINYNNYLTVLEAIGRAGGVGDYGRRDKVLVVRPVDKGTKTFRINLQDKDLLTTEGYFLLPNDVVIVQPMAGKILSLNVPTVSFALTILSTTLLLINYFGK